MRSIPRRRLATAVALASAGGLAIGTAAYAADNDRSSRTILSHLTGYEEDPSAISTPGKGTLLLTVDGKGEKLTYRLRYSGLDGTVSQAHIHFGTRHQSGGVSAFLCSNIGGPAGTPACPADPGEVRGTIEAADVVGPEGQGIAPGEIDELFKAIRADATYVNVHTNLYPSGEIRSQIEHNH
jgi:hypothetical protein